MRLFCLPENVFRVNSNSIWIIIDLLLCPQESGQLSLNLSTIFLIIKSLIKVWGTKPHLYPTVTFRQPHFYKQSDSHPHIDQESQTRTIFCKIKSSKIRKFPSGRKKIYKKSSRENRAQKMVIYNLNTCHDVRKFHTQTSKENFNTKFFFFWP